MNNNENNFSDESSDNDDFDEVEEEESVTCLFCDENLKSIEIGIKHLNEKHSFNLIKLKCKLNLDQYSYIKMINYIRHHKPNSSDLTETALWNDEKYLKPLGYEPWLTYDIEDLDGMDFENNEKDENQLSKDDIIKKMAEEIELKNELLRQATEDINKLRSGFKYLLSNNDTDEEKNDKKNDLVSNGCKSSEESYFTSYAHFDIHYQMLSDEVRTESYRDAFLNNTSFIQGKSVLDIGCGTSILCMFASKAGASKVVGIDNSEIIYNAMEIVRKNNFNNIELIKGLLEKTTLPIEKFDIIVSEWMGYFLIFEGMLDSVIYGRDRYLKPGGTLMPNRCTISLVGYGDKKRYDEYINFWNCVYNYDMSSVKSEVLHEPSFEICNPDHVLTQENVIIDYNLNTVQLGYSNFEYDFNLKCTKNGILTSFMGYFDTFFELPNKVYFSTSSNAKPTHWKQCIFYLDEPVNVLEGNEIKGKIICSRHEKNLRSLNVKIKVFEKEYEYFID